MNVRHVLGVLLATGCALLSACGDDNVAGSGAPTATVTTAITNTPVNTSTTAITNTPVNTSTRTSTSTVTNTATITNIPTITNTPAETDTPTNTPLESSTPTETPTNLPTATATSGGGAAVCGNKIVETGEECDNGSICVAGPLVPKGPVTCTGDGDCGAAGKCSPASHTCYAPCTKDADCGAGGACEPVGGNGCAKNCTNEGLRSFQFLMPRSPLAVDMSASDTTLTVVNGSGFPNADTITVETEQMHYSGKNGNTLLGLQRGVNGTTAAGHSAGPDTVVSGPEEGSHAVAQTPAFPVPLDLTGAMGLTTGSARAEDVIQADGRVVVRAGEIPLVVRSNNMKIDKVASSGTVCACLRGFEETTFGPGNSGTGFIGCNSNGLDNTDYLFVRDHLPTPQPPDCLAAGGIPDIGTPQNPHDLICSGAPVTTFSGHGDPGSAVVTLSVGIALIFDGGTCEPVPPNSPDAQQGPDGIPCTDDDADLGSQAVVPLTTGTGRGTVLHSGLGTKPITKGSGNPCTVDTQCNTAAGEKCANPTTLLRCGTSSNCECRNWCSRSACDTESTGTLFSCNAIQSSADGGLTGGYLASGFGLLDTPGGDIVVRLVLSPL